jgi:hypothetical protein
LDLTGIGWDIVGGASGPRARLMSPSGRDRCGIGAATTGLPSTSSFSAPRRLSAPGSGCARHDRSVQDRHELQPPAADGGRAENEQAAIRASLSRAGIDWLIVGGESGAKFRPLDLDWVRDLRDRRGQTALFFKQVGGRTPKAAAVVGRQHVGCIHPWPPTWSTRSWPAVSLAPLGSRR